MGVIAGVAFSSLTAEVPTDQFATKTGIAAGAFADIRHRDRLGAVVDVLYERKGANDAASSASVAIDSLEIPVLLRVNAVTISAPGLTIYGLAGPAFGVLLRSKLDSGDSLTDELVRTDVGLSFGAGVEWARALIEARFTTGLRNIATAKLDLGGTLKSHTFAILAGWRF